MSLFVWIIFFQAAGFLSGFVTQSEISGWYQSLNKSDFTPPDIVFPIVWTILYLMLAISGWWLWQNRSHPKARTALKLFGVQMIFNWAWSPLFFKFHLISASLACILIITLLTLITILHTKDHFKLSSVLLIPYFIWLLFAAYLNVVIWKLN